MSKDITLVSVGVIVLALAIWERTGSVLRIDTDGGNRPERIPTYCPKIICSIGQLMETLEDRAFEIILVRTRNRDISSREVHQASKEWTPIRDGLYLCLMQYWKEIRQLAETITNDLGLPGRLWNIAKPLIVLSRFVDRRCPEGKEKEAEAEVIKFIRNQQAEKEFKAESSLTGSVLEAVESALQEEGRLGQEKDDYLWRIPVSRVLEKVREIEGDFPNPVTGKYSLSSKQVTGILTNLRLYKEPKRDQPNGSYSFLVSKNQVKDSKERLSVKSTTEHTERSERPEHKTGVSSTPSEQQEEATEHSTETLVSSSVPSVSSVSSVSSVNDSTELATEHENQTSVCSEVQLDKKEALATAFSSFDFALNACTYQFYNQDFNECNLPENLVYAVITDPPWAKQYLHCWEKSGQVAAKVLKPGGFYVALAGRYNVREKRQALEKSLTFYDIKHMKLIGVKDDGYEMKEHGKNDEYYFLIFYKPPLTKEIPDFEIKPGGMRKDLHPWGEPDSESVQLVEHFSKPGDLILEPFGGAGPTVAACIQTKRSCIAYDIDPQVFETMKNRFSHLGGLNER